MVWIIYLGRLEKSLIPHRLCNARWTVDVDKMEVALTHNFMLEVNCKQDIQILARI